MSRSDDPQTSTGTDPGTGSAVTAGAPIVWLGTAPNEPIGRMWADVLEDQGIRTLVKAGGAGVGAWGSAAVLEHQLFVLEPDLARAQGILADLGAEEDATFADAPDEGEDGDAVADDR